MIMDPQESTLAIHALSYFCICRSNSLSRWNLQVGCIADIRGMQFCKGL